MSFGGSGGGSGAISSDSDVALSNPANGQVLAYSSTVGKWQNQATTDANAVHKGDLVFNIVDYGASTASADNKTAIDNAITAAAAIGGTVFFPPGLWKTTGQHNLPMNVSVVGAGKGVTTIEMKGVGTYCFFIGSTSGGPNAPTYTGLVGHFSMTGEANGNGTGPYGQQIGIYVLNCLFFNLQDIFVKLIYKAFLIDGGDETTLGAGTFAGQGYMANCTTSNVYIGFHFSRWVTDSCFNFLYAYGGSPIQAGSIGFWMADKMSTSTFINPTTEGIDTGYKIGTSRQGICLINPRIENCNTYVSWENGTWGHVVLGGSSQGGVWAAGANTGANTIVNRDGWFPEVTSLPTPSAAYHKAIYRVLGTTGVADGLHICIQDATGSYVWHDLLANNTGGSGGSGLLAAKTYNPASATPLSTTANTTTFQDADATNLAVSFTAPSSGQVLVRLTGLASRIGTSANFDVYWNLRDANGDIAGTGGKVLTSTGLYLSATLSQVVSGLTPGQTYVWKWGHRASALGSDWQATLRVGGDPTANGYAPATMEVWSA